MQIVPPFNDTPDLYFYYTVLWLHTLKDLLHILRFSQVILALIDQKELRGLIVLAL